MQRILPDFTRMIDLPGVGPCPRPVDIDQSVTGFSDLVSLRIYSFSGTAAIKGDAEEDEVLIVLLDGSASIGVSGRHSADYDLTISGTRAIYMPPDHHYRLMPDGRATIAYVRAKPRVTKPPQGFMSGENGLSVESYADRLQLRLIRLDAGQSILAETRAGAAVERLIHVLGVENASSTEAFGPWQTMALSKGETVTITAPGEVLIVSAN